MLFPKNFVKEIGKNVGYLLSTYYLKLAIGICYTSYYIVILKKAMACHMITIFTDVSGKHFALHLHVKYCS